MPNGTPAANAAEPDKQNATDVMETATKDAHFAREAVRLTSGAEIAEDQALSAMIIVHHAMVIGR